MGDKTAIEWTRAPDGTPGATWNPIVGEQGGWACVKVSPECAYCYAERVNRSPRLGGNGQAFLPGKHAVPTLAPARLRLPLQWRRPRRVFVCSMTDLFWDAIPDAGIDDVFNTMLLATQHNFLVLTKRAERLAAYVDGLLRERAYLAALPPHIRVGVTAGNQTQADRRVPELLKVPAAVRFLSAEPLLGPVDVGRWLIPAYTVHPQGAQAPETERALAVMARAAGRQYGWRGLDWVIAGGESGGPQDRRLVEPCPHDRTVGGRIVRSACRRCAGTTFRPKPAPLAWARSLRDQCQAAGVAFFWKQWGGSTPKAAGRELDGREWSQFPDDQIGQHAVLPPFTSPTTTKEPIAV